MNVEELEEQLSVFCGDREVYVETQNGLMPATYITDHKAPYGEKILVIKVTE